MKNKIFITVFLCLSLITLVSALQTKIVETDITIDYDPSGCTTDCVNTTLGNLTTEHCTETCRGTLTISGENLLKEFTLGTDKLHEVLNNNVVRQIGNESDITNLIEELTSQREYEAKYNLCLDSNRNVSVKMLMMEDECGYKNNYTECTINKNDLQSRLNSKELELSNASRDLDEYKTNQYLYLLGGALAMFIIIKFVLPKLQGKNIERDPGERGFPPGDGY